MSFVNQRGAESLN